ncbi:MAG TPA: hypothetical protein VIE39_08165 [Thermoanaerobaculia bacterium]|jgi:hypothetical protein
MIFRGTLFLLVAAGIAAAQQGAIEDKIRQQAEEIARLMRESERLLLELSNVDRIFDTQEKIVEELRKLMPPETPQGAGADETEQARKRKELEEKQANLAKQIEEMLSRQAQSAQLTAKQLEELLKNLPRQQSQGGEGEQGREPQASQEEREKRLREQQEARKQHQPQAPRQEQEAKDKTRNADTKRPPDKTQAEARRERIDAWIASLPPEEQERINRNDFSSIPLRYRRLVEEYTAARSKREAEEGKEGR